MSTKPLAVVKWDTRVQTPDEARRMRAYVRFAERHRGGRIDGMCATCAFRGGTEANGSAEVLGMIEGTMLLGGMFQCHTGAEIDAETGCLVEDPDHFKKPCRGYLALRNIDVAPRAAPIWFCNKCGRVRAAASGDIAEHDHRATSPSCDYLPSWNWSPDNSGVPSSVVLAVDPSWSTPKKTEATS